jgi:uncharacterized iron-regulated membrane protein
MRIFFRRLHRWLGLLMAVQIIAWMASGLYFSIFPIAEIRGEHLTKEPVPLNAELLSGMGPPGAVKDTLDRHLGQDWKLEKLGLVSKDGQLNWRVDGRAGEAFFSRLLNAAGTDVIPALSAEQAARTARDWLAGIAEPRAVEWLESVQAGAEYRGRVLPVWKVSFDEPESLNLYLGPWTGEILARRTSRWRLFDFLWMLHIMDFETRDDFNHPLLQASSLLGLIIALSGVIFWAMTTSLFRSKRRLPVKS